MNEEEKNKIDLAELFPAGEHGIYAYYGRIGQGKTYAMTADILEALHAGRVVYVNYPIRFQGYSQESSWFWLIAGLFGLKKRYYTFPKDNLKTLDVDEHFHDNFSKLTDCIVALDEGYVAFDSYQLAKMSMKDRKNVLHTRHFDRSIWYTTQRPSAIHVTMRAQTNVFYKVKRILKMGKFVVFSRKEYDLGSDDSVDENNCFSTKLYVGKKNVFESYNTKYLRGGVVPSQKVFVEINDLKYKWILWRVREKINSLMLSLKRQHVKSKIT